MKISGMSEPKADDVLEVTRKQRYACNICTGVIFILAGIILLFAGVNIIKASVVLLIAPTVLAAIGCSFFVSALIQKNTVNMWLSGIFLTCALVCAIEVCTNATYANLYPLFIAAPAVASAMTIGMSPEKGDHAKIIIFCSFVAAIFAFQSSGLWGWSVVAPIAVVYFGLCILVYAIHNYKHKDEDAE